MSHRPSHLGERRVHSLGAELVNEVTACPANHRLVLLVSGIENDLQELLIPVDTTHVFRWTAALTAQADRMLGRIGGCQDLLQYNLVTPIVAEVVLVDHAVAFLLEHACQLRLAFVDQIEFVKLIPLRDAPVLAVLLELVEMAVGPAHDRLDRTVETAQSEGTQGLNTPPYWRIDVLEGDLQLVDGGRRLRAHKDIVTSTHIAVPTAVRLRRPQNCLAGRVRRRPPGLHKSSIAATAFSST